MPNMSYCRFQNTVRDLADCEEHLDDTLTGDEKDARDRLIRICKRIAEQAEADYQNSDEELPACPHCDGYGCDCPTI